MIGNRIGILLECPTSDLGLIPCRCNQWLLQKNQYFVQNILNGRYGRAASYMLKNEHDICLLHDLNKDLGAAIYPEMGINS